MACQGQLLFIRTSSTAHAFAETMVRVWCARPFLQSQQETLSREVRQLQEERLLKLLLLSVCYLFMIQSSTALWTQCGV